MTLRLRRELTDNVSSFQALTLNFNITKKLIPLFVQLLEDVDQAIATGNPLRIGNKVG